MNHPALLVAAALAVILAVAWLSSVLAERRRRGVQARLAVVLGNAQVRTLAKGNVSLRRSGPIGGGVGVLPSRLHSYLVAELAATGDKVGGRQLVVAAVVGATLAVLVLLLVLQVSPVVAVPLTLVAGIATAGAWLRSAQGRFQRRFVALFPDALDAIVRAVRAGLPVLDAIEAAVLNLGEPVAGEFGKLLDEMRIGIDLEQALMHAANRIRVNDFRFFAATLVLQRRTGGSLSETLSNLAGLIRRRKELRLKGKALSAESRATAYVIGAMPFVMTAVIYVIDPGLISMLFTDPRGKVMFNIAFAMLVVGFAVMRSMIKRASR